MVLKEKKWLVGEKCTYADLAFVPWDVGVSVIFERNGKEAELEGLKKELPSWWAWHERLVARDTVKKVLAVAETMAAAAKAAEEAAAKEKK